MHAVPRGVVLVALSSTVAACASAPDPSTPAAAASSAGSAATVPLVTNLTPPNYGGGQVAGKIRLAPTGRTGEFRSEIEIRGAGYQNRLPWASRVGRCGEQGIELGTPLSYPVIVTGPDGIGKVAGNVSVPLTAGQTYSVVVMKGQTERDVIVSCGVLSPSP